MARAVLAAAQRGPARLGASGAEELPAIRTVAVELEPDLIGRAVGPRLDAEHEYAGEEVPARFVQEHRVDPVAIREVHAGRHEDVVPPVGVEVVHAGPPGPTGFDPHRVRDLFEAAAAAVREERVP